MRKGGAVAVLFQSAYISTCHYVILFSEFVCLCQTSIVSLLCYLRNAEQRPYSVALVIFIASSNIGNRPVFNAETKWDLSKSVTLLTVC